MPKQADCFDNKQILDLACFHNKQTMIMKNIKASLFQQQGLSLITATTLMAMTMTVMATPIMAATLMLMAQSIDAAV